MNLFDKSYSLNKRLLSIIGHWPYQCKRQRWMHQTFIVLCQSSIIIPALIKLFQVWGDAESVFDCIPSLGLHTINIAKWINCVANGGKLTDLLTRMEVDWNSRDDKNGSDILRKYAGRGRFLTVFYSSYMLITGALCLFVPLIPLILDVVEPLEKLRPREYVYRAEYFVDQDRFFVPIYVHATVTAIISTTIISAFDTMYAAYIHYACALFAELCQELENGAKKNGSTINGIKSDDYTYQHIVQCVKKHKNISKFCGLLESTYSVYFFIATAINVVLLSFTGVQTILKLGDVKWAVRFGIYAVGQIVHILFGCWHGQLLTDHSLQINDAIYNSKWYTSSPRSQRVLKIMMTRCAKPCQLSTGKIFSVRLETFSIIIKSAMSYFTVLRSLE